MINEREKPAKEKHKLDPEFIQKLEKSIRCIVGRVEKEFKAEIRELKQENKELRRKLDFSINHNEELRQTNKELSEELQSYTDLREAVEKIQKRT